MLRTLASAALALLLPAWIQAATTNTTLTVNATGSLSGTTFTASGQATFTNNIGSGTFSPSVSITALADGTTATIPFTITLSGGAGTITGNISAPVSVLLPAIAGT